MTQNKEVVGRAARILDSIHKKLVVSLDIIKIVPKKTSKTFLYSFLRFSGFGLTLKEFAYGVDVMHLNKIVRELSFRGFTAIFCCTYPLEFQER